MAPRKPSIKLVKDRPAKKRRGRKSPEKSPGARRRVIITLPEKKPNDSPNMPKLAVQLHGGAIYVGGVPGNRGGGRPPNEFKGLLAECVSHDEVVKAVMSVLVNPASEHWGRALAFATKIGYPELALASKGGATAPLGTTDESLIARLRTLYERAIRAVHYDETEPLQRALPAEIVPPE